MRGTLFSGKFHFPNSRWRSLSILFLIFFGSLSYAQSVATQTFSAEGDDVDHPEILINPEDITVNDGQPIQSIKISAFEDHYYDPTDDSECNNYYAFNVGITGGESDGFSVTEGCGSDFTDTAISNFSELSIMAVDIDNYPSGDYLYFTVTLEVTYETPSCPAPTNLSYSQLSLTSAELNWDSDGNSFELKWGEAGFAVETEGTLVDNLSETSYTLENLITDTAYSFYVRNDCGDDEYSSWAGPYNFSVGYCKSIPSSNDASGINNVTMGDVSFPVSDVTYYNYTGNVANIAAGTTIIGSVTFATGYAYYANIWIDLNDDGVFDNDSELLFQGESGSSNPTTLDTSFPLSEDAMLGQHQMRIGTADSGQATPNPCYSGSYGVTIDLKVNVTPPPTCIAPTDLAIDNITSDSVDLSWTSDGDTFDVSWGEGNFDAQDGTIENDFENGGTLSGLSSNTAYQFYVRNDCGGGDVSDWAGPFGFSTSCEPASIPFFEGFENGFTDNTAVNGCWSQESVTGPQTWTANSSATNYNRSPRTGSWNAFLRYSNQDWLFYPVELVGGTNYVLEFYARQDGSNSSNASVSASYGNSNTAAAMTNAIANSTGIVNGGYQLISGTFTPATSGIYYIGIRGTINSSPYYISIDDISIDLAPSCITPTGVTLETTAGHSADFSWDAEDAENYDWFVFANDDDPESATPVSTGNTAETFVTVSGLDPETAYDFYVQSNCGTENGVSELSAKVDFTTTVACPAPTNLSSEQLSLTSANLTWESSGSDFELKWGEAGFDLETEGTLVDDLTETSYTLESLTTDTDYQFYVRSDCAEDGFSSWAGPYSFSVGYCAVPSPSNNDATGITYVSFGDIDNPTTGSGYYNSYTSIVNEFDAGNSYDLNVRANTGGNYTVYVKAWIDWNNDGDFDTSTEQYNLGTANNVADGLTSNCPLSISVPITAEGQYRMRIRVVYNTATFTACSNNSYSEAEDYMLNVSGPVTWTGAEWINGSPADDVSVLINGGLSIANDAPGLEVNNMFVSENGSVTVEAGNTLTVNGKITNENSAENFIVENNSNLIQTNDDENFGAITVQRNSEPMIRLDYTLWSSPVVNQNLFGFSPETVNGVTNYIGSPGRIYIYDGDNGYVNPDSFEENSVMDVGEGYLYRSPNNFDASTPNVYNGEFIGVPFNGDLSITTIANNYTSIGNPYPSNLDADLILAGNSGINTLYLWVNTTLVDGEYTGTNYATYTNAGGTANAPGGTEPSGIVAVGQGFIVRTTDTSINLNNSMRTSESTDFFKTTNIERHRFWLNLFNENGLGLNQIMVAYMDGATSGYDNQIDGRLFGYEGSAIYSLIEERSFSIQGRGLPFEDTDVVPIGFKANESGKFKIDVANFDGLFAEGQKIYLKDKKLDFIHDLTTSGYEFDSEAGVFNNRFEILYKEDETMGVDDLTANGVLIYKNQNFIEISSKISPIQSVEIYDLQGRKLFSKSEINTSIFQINSKQFGSQILVVKVKTENEAVTNKKMVNK